MGKFLADSLFKCFCIFRKTLLIALLLSISSFIIRGQTLHPDLGLHGEVTWLTDTKIRVEYDWSDDSQLLDWTPTNGSSLVRTNGAISIAGGVASVRSMIWKQIIKCTRIYAQDAQAINSSNAHLNFITNVCGWTGYNFNPQEIIGVIYKSDGNLWIENGTYSTLPSPAIILGNKYLIEIIISETSVTTKSSSDNVVYSYNLMSPPDADRQVAIGGWGGDTKWGNLIIEGEIDTNWVLPEDMIDIQSGGAIFSPVIEVTGNPVIEWIFDDGSTSTSTSPVKNYGNIGVRHNLLRVTPWSALTGINVGYDAADGGYGGFTMIENQNILGIQNMFLSRNSLRYICASHSPLSVLDLTGFTSLEFIELVLCHNLASLELSTHPYLERICVEDCNLSSLDLSGCSALEDIRGANNRYSLINWGTIGENVWHICIRSNPQFTVNLPNLTQFPSLRELLIWDANQNGALECHSSVIQRIDAFDNNYTIADLNGCTSLYTLSLSGNKLSSLNLGSANSLTEVNLKECNMIQNLTDYVLHTLDNVGRSNGTLDLSGNEAPSSAGLVNYNNLKARGWDVSITEPGQLVPVSSIIITGTDGITAIDIDKGSLQLNAEILPVYATDKSLTWSITSGQGLAAINENGLISALKNGTITIRATANDGSGVFGELIITILNQIASEDNSYTFMGKVIVDGDKLRILLEDDYNSWKARLFDINGRLFFQKHVDSYLLEFDISNLVPGVYLITLSKGYKILSTQFFNP